MAALRASFKPLAAVSLPGGDPSSSDAGAGADAVRARAEAVLAGRQMLFGREIDLGWPPRWDWRWDGLPEAAPFAGDLRSTWEAQRLQGLLPLARAASQDERFARAYIDGVLDFARHHGGPDGLAWESALEVGLRLVSLAQGLPRVAPSDAFAERHVELVRMLDRHARWLRADLSLDKVVRGNHLLGELAGLLAAGRLLPEARVGLVGRARRARAARRGDPRPVPSRRRERRAVADLREVRARVPGAGGRARRGPRRAVFRRRCGSASAPPSTISTRAPLRTERCRGWGTAIRDGAPTGARAIRTGRPGSWKARDGVLGAAPPAANGALLRRFPDGGHLVLRDGDSFLFLRGGPFGHGIPGPASHSHADLLAPVLYLEGEAVLVDPGVYGYAVGPALRDGLRGWEAHSAVSFGPDAGPIPAGTFRWRRIPPPARLSGEITAEGAVLEGEVRGGPRGNALLWHRSIHYNQLRRIWLILDRFPQTASGPVNWAFRFAPGVRLEQTDASGVYRVVLPSGRMWRLTLDPVGEIAVEEGWIAPAYGSMVTAPILRRRLGTPPSDARAEFAPLG